MASDMEDLATAGWSGNEARIRSLLLTWYSQHRRRLPWRGDPPPWSQDKAAHRRAADIEAKQNVPSTAPTTVFRKRLRSSGDIGKHMPLDLDASEGEGATRASSSPQTFCNSAYGTWVSEVMLQQTQVERVVGYWTRWMIDFPTVRDLASAPAAAVNAAWAGLGFYSRARRLHEGAKYVQAQCHGEFPAEVEELRKIPGIGPYTAGAIASIAFGQREPVVDGNVIRVFSRLHAMRAEANCPALVRRCWALAEELVDAQQPGAFNQALMELGATVCTPKAPACGRCPVQQQCMASHLARQAKAEATDFPAKAKRTPVRLRTLALAALQDGDGRWLLVRRPNEGLLAGQWEFPTVEVEAVDAGSDTTTFEHGATAKLAELLRTLLGVSGLSIQRLHACPPITHTFSHEKHTLYLFGADGAISPVLVPSDVNRTVWMASANMDKVGITSGLRKVFKAIDGACSTKNQGRTPETKTRDANH